MYGEQLYGNLIYSDAPSPINMELENITPNLMLDLPNYYYKSIIMKMVQNTNANQIGKLNFYVQDVLSQLSIDTATWGLEIWEKELGIKTDISKSYQFRREIVKAKIRGSGTTTKSMIKNVAESFSNAEVEVIEDIPNSSFKIKFIGVKGIPPNMAGLVETIEDIKPAHLAYSFEYTFTWWDKVKELTWNTAGEKTWDQLRVY